MNAFGVAFVATLLLAGVPIVVALVSSYNKEQTAARGGIAAALLFLLNWVIFYFGKPVVGFSGDSFYSSFWLWWFELAAIVFLLVVDSKYPSKGSKPWEFTGDEYKVSVSGWLLSIPLSLLLVFGLVVQTGGVFNQGRADVLKSALKVTLHSNTNDLPKTDIEHILTVPNEVVNLKVQSALKGDSSTRYAVNGKDSLSFVGGRMYWLTGIYPDNIFTDYYKVDGNSRGFISTDTEDYNANSQHRWDAAAGIDDNPNLMKVHENGWFQHDINRVLWNKYRGRIISNIHMEADDKWRPWLVASINKRPFGFNMGDTYPSQVIVIDPTTGADTIYDLDKAPAWVDQIWGQNEVKSALNNWGNWGQADYKFWLGTRGKTNRYQVGDDPKLVATKTGLAWQTLMTSKKKNNLASYYVLTNARTGETHAYQVPELQLEEKVLETIRDSGANRNKLQPTHPLLYMIGGVLTWVAPLLKNESDTGADAESSFVGLALLPAAQANNGTAVTMKWEGGDIRGDVFRAYDTFLATNTTTAAPAGEVKEPEISGTMGFVSPLVPEGNISVLYFTLVERPGVEFRIQFNITATPEVKYIKEGHKVAIKYRDGGQSPFTVIKYDDKGVALPTPK